jgi:hypothetical protein
MTEFDPMILHPNSDLYPDLVSAGGLRSALLLRAELLGVRLEGVVSPSGRQAEMYVGVKTRKGELQASLAGSRRIFLVRIWGAGAELATGKTESLDDLLIAMSLWAEGARLRAIRNRVPFIEFDTLGEAYENGDEVEEKWRILEASDNPYVARFAAEAQRNPVLAGLFPYLSHSKLFLSRCTGYPFTNDAPYVRFSSAGDYAVIDADDGREVVQTASPALAVGALADVLPHGYGPAVHGTARDLAQ